MKRFQPLKRRTFLRGAGAAMALPLLDGMRPLLADEAAGVVAPPVRLAWVFFANGSNYERWTPEASGDDWKPSPTLEPLAEVREELLILSGLAQVNARSLGDGGGDHARSAAAFLTGAHPTKTHGAGIQAGVSADQYAAQYLGRTTKLPSLELGTEAGRTSGSCDSGYACAYSNNISWRSAEQPSAKEINPRLAFERLFGDRFGDQNARARRIAQQSSILDVVADQARGLGRRLGGDDRRKLEEYFQSVREVERRVDHIAAQDGAPTTPAAREAMKTPPDKPEGITDHIRLMYDLMALAMQTDSTRITTFMLANEGSNRRYPLEGISGGHHELSHHKNDRHKRDQIAQIDRYLVENFAYFVKRLRDTPEGEGSLLDNCAVVYGGAISDGNRHDHHDLPIVLAGRAGGAFSPGRHLKLPHETPLCNLYLSMFAAAGAPADSFGDSTGKLAGLAGS